MSQVPKEINDKYQAAAKALDRLYKSSWSTYDAGWNDAIKQVIQQLELEYEDLWDGEINESMERCITTVKSLKKNEG